MVAAVNVEDERERRARQCEWASYRAQHLLAGEQMESSEAWFARTLETCARTSFEHAVAIAALRGPPELQDSDRAPALLTTDFVHARSGPSQTAPSVRVLSPFTRLEAVSSAGRWRQVRLPDDVIAFVYEEYLVSASDGGVLVTTDDVYARSGPSTTEHRLRLLAKSTSVDRDRDAGTVGAWFVSRAGSSPMCTGIS